MQIGKMKETIRTFSFKFLDESVTVSYRLAAINNMDAERYTGDDEQDRGALGREIERIVTAWSLEDGDENIKPTAENIAKYVIPTPFLRAVSESIAEDCDPKRLRTSRTT